MAAAVERSLMSSLPAPNGSAERRQSEERLQQIEAEQTRLLYAQAPIAFVVSVFNATLLAFFLRRDVHVPTLMAWWVLLISVYLARLALVWRYRQATLRGTLTRRWRTWFLIGAVSAGCAWGASGILLFPAHSLPHQLLLAFIIGGMAIGAVASLAMVRAAYIGFILPLTLPVACRFFLQGGDDSLAMGSSSLIFVTGILAMASQFHSTITVSIALRFEKQDLLQSREALQMSHDVLEDRVRERTATLQQEVNERVRGEAQTRAMLQAIPDAVFRATREGIFLDYKPRDRFQSIVSSSFFVGRHFADVVPIDIATAVLRAVEQAFQTRETQVYEYPLTIQDETRDYEVRLAVSAPDEVVGIIRDITQRKEIERLKDDLVSTVSHELRTPLTSLRGFTELLLTRAFSPEKQRDILFIMQREAERLTNLINDFLDLRRMEAGQEIYQFVPVQLEPVLKQSLATFLNESGPHTFRVEIDEPLPRVVADEDRVHQVLTNLLSNAIKFSPAGGEVVLGVRPHDQEVIVWVRDHGIGIPQETLPKIFDRFFRVENGMTRTISGTGLGLALVKEVVSAHKGRVWVESTFGQGSTFFFTLPVAQTAESLSV